MANDDWESGKIVVPEGASSADDWESGKVVVPAAKPAIEQVAPPSALEQAAPSLRGLVSEPLEAAKRFGNSLVDVAVSPFKAAGEAFDATFGGPSKGGWGKVADDVVQGLINTGKGMVQESPALAGMVTGGALGAPLGPWGMAGGAAIVAAGGKTLQNLIGKYVEGQDISPRESNIQVYGAALNAVAPELGGRLFGKAVAPFRGRITPAGEKLTTFLQEQGVEPFPGDVRQAPLVDKLTGVSSKSFGGGAIRKTAQQELDAVLGPQGYIAKEGTRITGPRAGSSEDVGGLVQNELLAQETQEALKRAGTKADLEQQYGIAGETQASIGDRIAKNQTVMRAQASAQSEEVMNAMLSEVKGKPVDSPHLATALGDIGLDPSVVLKKYRDEITGQYIIPGEDIQGLRSRYLTLSRSDPKYKSVTNAILKDIENVPGVKESYDAWRTFHRQEVGEPGRAFKGQSPQDMWHHFEPMEAIRISTKGKDDAIGMLRILENKTGRQGPLWDATQGAFVSRAITEPRFLQSLGPETRAMFFPEGVQSLVDTIHGTSSQAGALSKRYGGKDAGRITSTLAAGGPGVAQELGILLSQLSGTSAESALRADLLQRIMQNVPRIRALKSGDVVNWRSYMRNTFGPDAATMFDALHNWATTSKAGSRALRSEMAPTGVNTPSVGQGMELVQAGVDVAKGNLGSAAMRTGYGAVPFAWSRFVSSPTVSRWLGRGYDVPSPYQSLIDSMPNRR